jgi:pimeloyl-ACP methyl ester carboxylesterase
MRWRERTEYRVDDRVLVVNRSGSTDFAAPLIVLVHGIGAGPTYLKRLAETFGTRARVEAVELPGHATSPRPASSMTIDDHARLLASYLERVGHRDVILVGHSMGAQVVSRTATLTPEALARVVMLGPVVDPAAPTAVGQALLLGLDTLRETPGANRGVFFDYLRCGVRWYAETLPAMLDFDLLAEARDLRRTGLPVTVIRGARDPIASREWCTDLAEAAGGTFLELSGSAHVVMWTSAHEVAHELLRVIPPTRSLG